MVSWRDLILIAGGVFLLYKASAEIHEELEGEHEEDEAHRKASKSFISVITQIIIIDLVFSIDSIVTAIGMAEHVEIMIVAVIIVQKSIYKINLVPGEGYKANQAYAHLASGLCCGFSSLVK